MITILFKYFQENFINQKWSTTSSIFANQNNFNLMLHTVRLYFEAKWLQKAGCQHPEDSTTRLTGRFRQS
jgi:hypothetical protein